MKIYSRTGDNGTTSLVYGKRVLKNDIRVEAYGTCDEANSMIGMALSFLENIQADWGHSFVRIMRRVQTIIFHVGAEISTPPDKEVRWKLAADEVAFLENTIDEWEKELTRIKQFILPGGSRASASFHVARTTVRRAERLLVQIDEVNPVVSAYLNRLSDFLFVAARYINNKLSIQEPILHSETETL